MTVGGPRVHERHDAEKLVQFEKIRPVTIIFKVYFGSELRGYRKVVSSKLSIKKPYTLASNLTTPCIPRVQFLMGAKLLPMNP